MKNLEKRMYFLVLYSLSGIQKAIQAGHAALEYAYQYSDNPEYVDFIKNWKTWIILNGGTSNSKNNEETGLPYGSLDVIYNELCEYMVSNIENHINFSSFKEPDLNDALTAICLVVDERVFNKKDYPDFDTWVGEQNPMYITNNIGTYLVDEDKYRNEYKKIFSKKDYNKIMFLRDLLNNKKLA